MLAEFCPAHLLPARAAALAQPAHIQRERVDPRCGQLRSYTAPRFSVTVDLMNQERSRPLSSGAEVRRLERRAVRSLHVNYLRRRRRLRLPKSENIESSGDE